MRLNRFRVQMFKCVIDSGWIDVSDLTVLVGKNEAGKTALLQALHKFNPFRPEPFSMARDWPRGHWGERSESQIVCSAEFVLDEHEAAELRKLTADAVEATKLVITRDYAGRFEVQFPAGAFPDSLHPNDVDTLCDALPLPPSEVHPEFASAAEACRAEAIRWAHEGRFSKLEGLAAVQESALECRSPANNPQQSHESQFRTQYLLQLQQLAAQLKQSPSAHRKAHEYVIGALPTFVHMDEYRSFNGTASLDQVKQRKDQGKSTEDDQTLLALMALAELRLDQEVQKATRQDREERQYDLDAAAATLNRKVQNHWKQLRYEVQFRTDGQRFMTFVKGLNDKALIRLEDRSRGFKWFFSFDLMLMHETRGALKGCVILMDEPGLHLHPSAQLDLLDILMSYAQGNTLIYTTHLPFMVDLRFPERIRVISNSDRGTIVQDNFSDAPPEAKQVLQAALGIKGHSGDFVAEQNLIVEGVDDFWILSVLLELFRRSMKPSLPPEILITPAGGPFEVTCLAACMVGQNLEVVALFDSDDAGNIARDKFYHGWLARYSYSKACALGLGSTVTLAKKIYSIEDLFPEDFYLRCVEVVYNKQLAAAGITLKSLPKGDQLACRLKALFESVSLNFDRRSVSKVLCGKLRTMKNASELPSDTLRGADQLLSAITKEFAAFRAGGEN